MKLRVEYILKTHALEQRLVAEVKYGDPELARKYAMDAMEDLRDAIRPKGA